MAQTTSKKIYPCEPAEPDELDRLIGDVTAGEALALSALYALVCPIAPDRTPWDSVHALTILGKGDRECNRILKASPLRPGVYVNHTGEWLLLVHPRENDLQKYLNRFGPHLKNLRLYYTSLTTLDLSVLRSLEVFAALYDLSIISLSGLENLTRLTTLDLSGCSSLTQLSGLENLTRLTHMDLFRCRSLKQLPGLENLTRLTNLELSGCSSLAQISGLENLTLLTHLGIFGCSSLVQIPGLENLTLLTHLDLSGCSNLVQIPGLENLTQLTHLDLSECRNLVQISGVENLTQLTNLNFSGCANLVQIPGLENLTQLTTLRLSGCKKLTVLPEGLSRLRSLRRLDLSHMELKTLPDWLPDIAERFSMDRFSYQTGSSKAIVNLAGTTVEDMPDMSIFTRPYKMVAQWFRDRKNKKTQLLNEIKVVFLGDGEAGKSHTIARLMNDGGEPKGYVDVRTPGIVIKDLHHPVANRDATLHLWDFGGQDIMHSMHRIFLTERTIYVVLVDGSIGNQDERARYWLQNIQSFARNAPVVLVLNKLDDDLQADVNAVDLRDKYKGLKRIVKLSALQYSQERFNREFRDVLLEEIANTGYLDHQWSQSWVQVKNALEQMKTNYIHGDDYLKICDAHQVGSNQKDLLKWFHDLGISFCYCDGENDAMEDYVVLKPNWITNALYIILFNQREGGNGGLVPIRTIRTMLGRNAPNKAAIKRVIPDAYYAGYDVNYVLDVFHAFQLSFRKGDDDEFFPMLADINAKPVAKVYSEDKNCLEFTMDFDYLPNNLLHRLMVDRNTELDMDNVWRTGARFELKELGLSAVVVIDGSSLRFFIRHENNTHRPNTYLTMLKANVDRIVARMGLNPPACQLIYKQDGRQDVFDYETLKAMLEAGQLMAFSMAWRRMIPIDDIFNQSAPELLTDEKKLLNAIIHSCQKLQDEPIYHLIPKPNGSGYTNGAGMEDLRNRRVRDDLITIGYRLADQTQRGYSGTGKSIGELDMLVFGENNEPWTIIEALRVSDGTKVSWNEHLKKLTEDYNKRGLSRLYLLTYVDSTPADFDRIWTGYQKHMSTHAPKSYTELNEPGAPIHTRAARFQYTRTNSSITVYHIFVQMDLRPETPDQ